MKKIIGFISYFPDQKDRISEITEEEYELIKPYSSELSKGNWPNDEKVSELLSDIMNNKSKEVDEADDFDIKVAIC